MDTECRSAGNWEHFPGSLTFTGQCSEECWEIFPSGRPYFHQDSLRRVVATILAILVNTQTDRQLFLNCYVSLATSSAS